MKISDSLKIEEFLKDIQFQSPENFEILTLVRKIFNDANPNLEEDIKYGGLVFSSSSALIGGIFPYSKHVSIEFSYGAELSDPNNILEGKGKKRRHIKITQAQDIQSKRVEYFVGNAVNVQGEVKR